MIKQRLAGIRRAIKEKSLDGLLVTLPANRRYLSGYEPDDGQWGESSGSLLITPAEAVLLTDFRYELSAKEQAGFYTVVIYKNGLAQELAALSEAGRIKKLGFEADAMLFSLLEKLKESLPDTELIPTAGLVSRLRITKDSAEVECMKKSLGLMEDALAQVIADGLTGKPEREVALSLMRLVEDRGAEGPSFDPIIASGPNGAEPHAEPGDRVIEAGDPVVMDVGCMYGGYASDITRTVVAGGVEQADEKFKEIYSIVLKANREAVAGIKPGMTGKQADAFARDVITEAGYSERFGHGLGHGVGLATHEAPSVNFRSEEILKPGMIFTIEPGIYLPGWGGVRLEQMVELTPTGCRLLNRLDDFYDFS